MDETAWADVHEAVQNATKAYNAALATRQDFRADSKTAQLSEVRWEEAHQARLTALLAQWNPELDDTLPDGSPSVASVLRRYYIATVVPIEGGRK